MWISNIARRLVTGVIAVLVLGGCDAASAFGPSFAPLVRISAEARTVATSPSAARRFWVTITNSDDADVYFLHEMAIEQEQWGGWRPAVDGVLIVNDARAVRIGAGETVTYPTPWTSADLAAGRYRLVVRLHAGDSRRSASDWAASGDLDPR